MKTKHRILELLSGADTMTGPELCEQLAISRQALSVHLRALIDSGQVVKSGSTRAARYGLASRAPEPLVVTRAYPLEGLEESVVYDALATNLGLRRQLRPHVEEIVRYAFTEMLNNAIDHSEAERCNVVIRLDGASGSFEVRDPGIGLFHSIASKLGLPDEQAAMLELVKGKTTTMAERHSGEGLFFTSKVADRFLLRSHKIQIEWVKSRDDVFVSERRFLRGTRVHFVVHRSTRRRLEKVFEQFAPEEYDFRFQKTRIHVKLLQAEYVSRSEAKRLLANLEKFREVVLDFRDVRTIGQGFADEIFRLFAKRHPRIRIVAENANRVVAAMLRHVGG
jgi:biotin operon repressor